MNGHEVTLSAEIRRLKEELALAQAEARRNAERLEQALQGTLDCVTVLDREFRFTFVNNRAIGERDLGEILGRRIFDVLPGSENSVFGESYRRVMQTRVAESVEGFFPPLGCWYEGYTVPCDEGITVFFRNIDARKQAETLLQESEQRLRTTLNWVPEIVWSAAADGRCDYFNEPWYEFTGLTPDPEERRSWDELVHPEDREHTRSAWLNSLATGDSFEAQHRIRHHSGEYLWTLGRARAERNPSGEIVRWHGTCTNIHQRVMAEEGLAGSEALNRSIIDASADCIQMLDLEGRFLFVNEAGREAMELPSVDELLGTPWLDTLPEGVSAAAEAARAIALNGGVGHFMACRPQGDTVKWWDIAVTPVRQEGRDPIGLVVVGRDITHQKSAEERIRWSATHDALTHLPNRTLFRERMDEAIDRVTRKGGKVALLLLDADEFKQVNDALGHDVGDKLLCTLADRLRLALRPKDFAARLGGDEFAIILSDVEDREDVRARADAILGQLRAPFIHEGRVLDCGMTIGASIYPGDGRSTTEMLKNADIALYVGKTAGRGRISLFESAMRSDMQNRLSMLALARDALGSNLIAPFYQPKVDLKTLRVIGFEALLRWRHPSRGIQLPETIAAAFEDIDLAEAISDRMIDGAIADMRGWLDRGVDFGHVAINASAAEFRRGDFAERLLARLAAAAIPVHHMQLEVTETVFLGRGADCVDHALKTLSVAGMKIALDDFGTGYASLSHLKQFPVDIIKIDRSFVRDLEEDPDDAAIIKAVINLGQSLNIDVVAEGIETPEQESFLAGLHCNYGQGFLYGKAAPAARVPGIVRSAPMPMRQRAA